jgi:hypothetical protein
MSISLLKPAPACKHDGSECAMAMLMTEVALLKAVFNKSRFLAMSCVEEMCL